MTSRGGGAIVRAMLRATIVPLTLLLLAPACGDKDDDTGETGAANATTTVTATDPAVTGETGAPVTTTGEPATSGTTHASHETGEPTTGGTGDDTTGGGNAACDAYCATITTNCPGAETQYGNAGFCAGSCATLPPGAAADMAGNTLGCRTYHAGAAMMDPVTHCVHAGPGGAGVCGSNCEGFCTIAMAACPEKWVDSAACMAACGMWDDSEKYDATDLGGNTLACRLYHATAATVDGATHCPHVGGDSPPCM